MFLKPLVWLGTWRTPAGLPLCGFHVWDELGCWVGVYKTWSRASAEANAERGT